MNSRRDSYQRARVIRNLYTPTSIAKERPSKRIRALINDEGEIIVNKRGIANLLSEKFHEAFNKKNGEELPTFESRCANRCELNMKLFSYSNILAHLTQLNKRKSCGNDGVNPYVLQNFFKIQ